MWVQEVCTECTMRHLVSYVNKHPQYVCWKSDYLAMQLSMLFRLQIYTNTYTHKAFDGDIIHFLIMRLMCTPWEGTWFSLVSAHHPSPRCLPVSKTNNKL